MGRERATTLLNEVPLVAADVIMPTIEAWLWIGADWCILWSIFETLLQTLAECIRCLHADLCSKMAA